MPIRRPLRLAVALAATTLSLGCVNPGDFELASVWVDLVDDPAGSPAPFSGEFTTMSVVQLSEDGVSWMNIGTRLPPAEGSGSVARRGDAPLLNIDAPVLAHVELQDASEPARILWGVDLPAGTYRWVRLIMMPIIVNERGFRVPSPVAMAKVSGTVGDATYAEAETRFDRSLELVVDRQIAPIEVGDGDKLTIIWDLNAEQWITPEAMTTGLLSRPAVTAAVTVRITH